jgi:tRNA(Ile2) C34 agmatinyltransferase TiaS
MDMNMNNSTTTEEESRILFKAVEEFERNGETEILCPRCGGKLRYVGNNSGYRISCEKDGCIMLTVRGI